MNSAMLLRYKVGNVRFYCKSCENFLESCVVVYQRWPDWFVNLEPGELNVVEEKCFCDTAYDLQGLCSPVTCVPLCHLLCLLFAILAIHLLPEKHPVFRKAFWSLIWVLWLLVLLISNRGI